MVSRTYVFLVLLLSVAFVGAELLLPSPSACYAQTLPRAGRHFTFGVIEGPDNANPASLTQTDIYLMVVSQYDGCGTISSPSGYTQAFNFQAQREKVIRLDHKLMHLFDNGKTNKGLLVQTSEPVNLVFHDYAQSAGDATQILPDEALDTSYVVAEWGIFNDRFDNEDNRTVFLVTAAEDSTLVTITPSVRTLAGEAANVPFTVELNKGECYVVKADSTSPSSLTSLSNSSVVASRPVSVIVSNTCGYVPLGVQSCNELVDELIGKKWWGSDFFVQPLGNADSMVVVLMTSDVDFVAGINGSPNSSTNGRLVAIFSGAADIRTNARVQMHQLTRGSDYALAGISDPTLVTVLPVSQYVDTMLWYTPVFPGSGFANWVPIVYPTAAVSQIVLDNFPLTSYTGSKPLNGTMSRVLVSVNPGVHYLRSPVPVFAMVTGFDQADAYSFVPGTVGPYVPHDTIRHTLKATAEPATMCSAFGIDLALDSALTSEEGIGSLRIVTTYDPATLLTVGIEKREVMNGALSVVVDSSVPGTLDITIVGKPFLTGRDIARLIFDGVKSTASTTLTQTISTEGCSEHVEVLTADSVTFAVSRSTDTLRRTLALHGDTAVVCQPTTFTLTADSIVHPGDRFVPLSLVVSFDTSVFRFQGATAGALLAGTSFTPTGGSTGTYSLRFNSIGELSGSDSLLTLLLLPTGVPPTSATATVRGVMTFLLCNDTVTRAVTLSVPIAPNIDSTHTTLSVATASVTYGNEASSDVTMSGLPAAAHVRQFDLYVTYNHDVLSYYRTVTSGTLTNGWTVSNPTAVDSRTDLIHFTSPNSDLGVSGTLAHLIFATFVADSAQSPIVVHSSLPGVVGPCAVIYRTPQSATTFAGANLCGDSLLRLYMQKQPIVLTSAVASASTLRLTLDAAQEQEVTIDLSDLLGRSVLRSSAHVYSGESTILLPLEGDLASGNYVLRIAAGSARPGSMVLSRTLQIVR